MYSMIYSGALRGVSAYPVSVEVDIARGLPGFNMVGSLSSEVRESRERVLVALKNAGFTLPSNHITVNLSPADIRKEGTAFDLPIAVGVLEAMGLVRQNAAEGILFLGELGLDGELKKARGVLPIVRMAAEKGVRECIVPAENAKEGAVIQGVKVRGATDIREVTAFLAAKSEKREEMLPVEETVLFAADENGEGLPDFGEVAGQETAKRAAEIAAAGFHNLLMVGPPGAGKSMIARRIAGILPPLTWEESLEVSSVFSVAGILKGGGAVTTARPFQSPHHSVTQAALLGGGRSPKPGVISLAHRGVLFLDELTEFRRTALDSLRQPIEERCVNISRADGSVTYPSDFMLVCAMNPCPCGCYPDRNRCRCSESQIRRYMGKVSGPILDRIDLCVELQQVNPAEIGKKKAAESSADIRKRVMEARERQRRRFAGSACRFNGDIPASAMESFCALGAEEQACMERLYRSLGISFRAYHRILRVARTIADLAGEENIKTEHLMEAACYRPSPEYWL